MKKGFRTGCIILIVVCVLAAGLYAAGRMSVGYAKLCLSQYIDRQVEQQLAQKTAQWQSQMAVETESGAAETKESEPEAVEANSPVQEEPPASPAELILPRVLYFRKTAEDQQYNIYYKNITAGEYDTFELVSQDGIQLNDCYRLQTGELKNELFEVVMRLFSGNNEVLASQGVIFHFVEQQSEEEINLMCIGDS